MKILRNRVLISRLSTAALLVLATFFLFASPASAGEERQIATVVQRGSSAYAYDEKGSQMFSISAGDGIVGFTSSTVSIRRGGTIYIYNNKGSQVSSVAAGR